MEKTLSVDIMSGSITKSILATGDQISPLFDRRYHKLEVIGRVSHVNLVHTFVIRRYKWNSLIIQFGQVTLRLDCEIIARSAIAPSTAVSSELLGSLVTSPVSGVTVDIQEMLFKCGGDEATCCELDGKVDLRWRLPYLCADTDGRRCFVCYSVKHQEQSQATQMNVYAHLDHRYI